MKEKRESQMHMQQQYAAYANAVQTTRKTQQVVMLYDGAIRSVKQAKKAIEEGDVQTRYNALAKACDIILGLQLSLDHENGGEIAKLLYDYYAGIDMRLMSVHSSQDKEMCELVIRHLKMMRDAWVEIDENLGTDAPASKETEHKEVWEADTGAGGTDLKEAEDDNIIAENEEDEGKELRLSRPHQKDDIDFSDPRVAHTLQMASLSLSV